MQISHVVSDAVLASVGFFVFFRYLLKLELIYCLLWESFILSIAFAAFFGTIRFAGFEAATPISSFFQHLAASAGALGLVAVSFSLALDKPLTKNMGIAILAIGFILFFMIEGLGFMQLTQHISLFAIPMVLVLGVVAVVRGKKKLGFFLVLGVVFAALATFSHKFLPENFDKTDVYHYLIALSIFSFGNAANNHEESQLSAKK